MAETLLITCLGTGGKVKFSLGFKDSGLKRMG